MQPKILSPFVTSVLLATALTATAATFTWDGGGADTNSGLLRIGMLMPP